MLEITILINVILMLFNFISTLIDCTLDYIKLDKFRLIYNTPIKTFHNISVLYGVHYISIFTTFFVCLFVFFKSSYTRIDILRRSVTFPAREHQSEPISCIFGGCLYQNNPHSS